MNKRFRAKWLSAFLVVLMTLGAAVPVFASDPNARTISIHTIDGSDITLSRAARTTTPRAGQRLASGNVLTTGAGSTVSFLMDGSSILEMAELSRVAVTSASRRLVLTVQSGAALVNATPQTEGRTLETRIGNVGLTVRGTMFTVEHSDYESTITMLSGYGDAGGVPLSAGSVLTIETGDDFGTVSDMDLGTLSLFALQSIYNNASYLTGVGTISTADLPNINSLMNEREAEHAQRQEQRTNNRTQAVQQAQERREPPPPPTTPAPTTPPRTQPAQQPDYEPYIPYTPTPTAPPPRFNVTVNGSHHTNPGSGSFAAGHSVTIRAGSRAGYDFAGWTGSVNFANAGSHTTSFHMPPRNVTVTANWTPQVVQTNAYITINYPTAGTVYVYVYSSGVRTPVTTGMYVPKHEPVTFEIVPDSGYLPSLWTINSHTVIPASFTTTHTITPQTNITITADFTPIVDLNQVLVHGIGADIDIVNDVVTLATTPRAGYNVEWLIFEHEYWGGDFTDPHTVTLDFPYYPLTHIATFAMPSGLYPVIIITAEPYFAPITSITVTNDLPSGGRLFVNGSPVVGDVMFVPREMPVDFEIVPNAGHVPISWFVDGVNIIPANFVYTHNIPLADADINITIDFAQVVPNSVWVRGYYVIENNPDIVPFGEFACLDAIQRTDYVVTGWIFHSYTAWGGAGVDISPQINIDYSASSGPNNMYSIRFAIPSLDPSVVFITAVPVFTAN